MCSRESFLFEYNKISIVRLTSRSGYKVYQECPHNECHLNLKVKENLECRAACPHAALVCAIRLRRDTQPGFLIFCYGHEDAYKRISVD
jgi:nitrite reductase/ring-hydroxylating ferredoxin subunit